MTTPVSWCEPGPPPPPPPDPRQVNPESLSNLCSRGWRRLLVTGLLRDELIRIFTGRIEEHDLRQLIWRPGTDTGILIESITRWRAELVEKRPALIVKPNAYRNLRISIGDQAGADGRGQRLYCTTWVGSHTVFCIHGSGAGVEILAGETQTYLTRFGPALQRDLGLLKWSVTEVGAISELEEAHESFVVPITIAWAYQDTWVLEKETPKLRRITLKALLDL